MTKKKDLSKEDKKIWEDFVKNPADIYDKDRNNFKYIKNKRFKFDLHGFSLDEANKKVKEIILSCLENNYREILLITGKGLHSTNDKDIYVSKELSKLKYSGPNFIQSDTELSSLNLSIREADVKDGGEGAILIKLRNL